MAKKKTTGNIIGILENNGNYFFKTVKDPDRMKYVYLHTNLLYKRVPIKSIQFVKFLTSGIMHIM
ncbi:hypothetical protein EROP_15310 [Erysipelotrichaceae bacterium OPF54]|nr:hypothetical protein EROP_15310 [Erysipelotrichaceae bacterium OPF54]